MDKKDEELMNIQPLLCEISTMRQNNFYKKLITQTYRSEIKSWRNVEIVLTNPNVKFADPSKWPSVSNVPLPKIDVTQPLKEYAEVCVALDFLK